MKWWDRMPWSSFSECWALSQLFHSPLSLSSRGFLVPLHLGRLKKKKASLIRWDLSRNLKGIWTSGHKTCRHLGKRIPDWGISRSKLLLPEHAWSIPVHRFRIRLYSQSGMTGIAKWQIKLERRIREPWMQGMQGLAGLYNCQVFPLVRSEGRVGRWAERGHNLNCLLNGLLHLSLSE